MDTDKATTITGIIKAAIMLGGLFGISLSPESYNTIVGAGVAVYAVVTLVHGWLTNKKVE